jgi:hypothetical protein
LSAPALVGLVAEAAKVLTGARLLVGERTHWTKGTFARDQHGRAVAIDSDRAYRFCAAGAIARAEVDLNGRRLCDALARSPLAHQMLGRAFGRYILPSLGYDCDGLRRGQGMVRKSSERECPWDSYFDLVVLANDLPESRHVDVAAAFALAIAMCEGTAAALAEREGDQA